MAFGGGGQDRENGPRRLVAAEGGRHSSRQVDFDRVRIVLALFAIRCYKRRTIYTVLKQRETKLDRKVDQKLKRANEFNYCKVNI